MTSSFIACIDKSGDEGFVFLPGEKGTGPFAAASIPRPRRAADMPDRVPQP
jgi:hypothetical protein